MLEPVRPGAVSPDRALCLPTFSHVLIVNKNSLSLSLSQVLFCCGCAAPKNAWRLRCVRGARFECGGAEFTPAENEARQAI